MSGTNERPLIRKMIWAERRKLLTRRGMMIITSLLTVGVVLVVFIVLAILHATDPAHHGPAGGVTNLHNALGALIQVSILGGVILASVAGTQDVDSGVFTDLVATGRSRGLLYAVRVIGLLEVFAVQVAIGLAVIVAGSYLFADGTATPTGGDVADAIGVMVVVVVFTAGATVGLASLIGSRSIATGVPIGVVFIAGPLLSGITALGVSREGLPLVALVRLIPESGGLNDLRPSIAVAVGVLLAWAVVMLAAGAWRTSTRDA